MSSERLVIDSSPLNYFARSNQLPVLEKLLSGRSCLITKAVEEELLVGASKHPKLYQVSIQPWITVAEEFTRDFYALLTMYHLRLGGGKRDIGEAMTLAYAEVHGITAMIDDRSARKYGKSRGVKMTGTLELLCQNIRKSMISTENACEVIDLLAEHEAFLPCDGDTFIAWAQAEGLLDP
uniref:hypothetical protein n=1 Tax=Herbidospora sakaeratensis TaxID=564415 RepID=UPI0007843E4A|nr:hypothetical protein [Herbidospora sakaeratensis]